MNNKNLEEIYKHIDEIKNNRFNQERWEDIEQRLQRLELKLKNFIDDYKAMVVDIRPMYEEWRRRQRKLEEEINDEIYR